MSEHCVVCGEDSIVGWGTPPRPLCLEHFQGVLKETKTLIDRARSV